MSDRRARPALALFDSFSVLRDRQFRRYFVGQTLSGFGSALSSIALAFATLSITHSATALGVVLTASRLPQIVFALVGGALGDRFSRRLVMLATDAARTVLQTATAVLLIVHAADLALLVSLQALAGAGSALFAPAANGLVANLAPEGRNHEAVSILGLSSNTASIAGFGIAGALVALIGPGAAFAVDAATFGASTISLALLRSPLLSAPLGPSRGLLADIGEGWEAVRTTSWLLTHCIYVALINGIALSPFFVLGPLVASRSLGGAPAWAGVAIAWAVGSMAGNLVTGRWQPHLPIAVAVGVTLTLSPVLLLLAFGASLSLVLPAAALAGAEASVSANIILTTLQSQMPDHLLSRATSFETIGSLVAAPLGMGLCGWAAGLTSVRAVFLFAGGWVIISSLIALCVPSVRHLRSRTSDSKLVSPTDTESVPQA